LFVPFGHDTLSEGRKEGRNPPRRHGVTQTAPDPTMALSWHARRVLVVLAATWRCRGAAPRRIIFSPASLTRTKTLLSTTSLVHPSSSVPL